MHRRAMENRKNRRIMRVKAVPAGSNPQGTGSSNFQYQLY